MEKEIKLPRISEDADSGMVSDIYVKEGDQVEAGQSIIAVESDKATVDVPIEESGTVTAVKVSEIDEISVGDVMILLETDREDTGEDREKQETNGDEEKASGESESKEEDKEGKQEAEAYEEQMQQAQDSKEEDSKEEDSEDDDKEPGEKEEETKDEQRATGSDPGQQHDEPEQETDDVPAAPLAKKFARELGVAISELKSEDQDQRITRKDVFEHAKNLIQKRAKKEKPSAGDQADEMILPDFSKWGETERKSVSGIRKATAENTIKSWRNIPHVTHFDEADVTSLETFRQEQDERTEEKLTVTAILLKVAAEALRKFPKFNASLDMQAKEIVFKKYLHIGVAVDTDDGLLLPVLRDVEQKPILSLAEELTQIARTAREGKLSPEDMQGGNFVISNLGGIGGTAFTPVIFPPQSAILGVSRAKMMPVYNGESFDARMILPFSLSYDHRLLMEQRRPSSFGGYVMRWNNQCTYC